MSRTAADGLVLINEKDNMISALEINSETDFVAKNKDFINFCKEISEINFKNKGDLKKTIISKMINNKTVEESLVNLISKIGEKITIRRSKFFDNNGKNFSYVHNSLEKNIGKVLSVVKLESSNSESIQNIGPKIAMHIAASSPLAIDKSGINKNILDKELEIIKEELKNSGKKEDMIDKISQGKLNKFVSDNTLLNQIWIMDTKKKVKDVLGKEIKVIDFVRFKVGEGVE
jgi:translation elongation factor Ts